MRLLHVFSLVAALGLLSACGGAGGKKAVSGAGSADGAAGGAGAAGQAAAPGTQADLVANVGDRVFFAYNSSALSSEAQASLTRQAQWLQTNAAVVITVEGHADERGTREYNVALGERRAKAVKKFLVAQGVDAARVKTISYGKDRPEVTGSTEEAWSKNRRSVTVVGHPAA